jgi:hypothetical protein
MKPKRKRINSTIPLLGGCCFHGGEGAVFTAGRVPFIRHPEPSLFEGVRTSSFKGFGTKESWN